MNRPRPLALAYLVLAPALVSMLYPLWLMFRLSLAGSAGGLFGHYQAVWRDGLFGRYLLNSAVVALGVVAGNVLFASLAGHALARGRFRGRALLLGAVLVTLMVPRQMLMIPLYLTVAKLGWVDTYAALIVPFLADGFNVFLMRQAFLGVPVELEDAARVDGAAEWRIFAQVSLPLVKPALAVMTINTFLASWNSFLYPLVLTTSDEMRTLPVGLALISQGEHSVDWGHLMAGSALAALPVIVVFLVFQRHIVRGIMAGAGR
ncbi:MAG TPA: carbohydrate ABC transporter permease [Candidatus Udaeobacter sp.]|nr:carbohydrate ABC transporter permease [Candidatus Udaeobacter sp.]